MNLEIHTPELQQRVQSQIQSGHFHDVEELLSKALDALEEKATGAPVPATPHPRPPNRKSLVEVCDPIRGLTDDLDFSRNKSGARPVEL
jgi:hypothetical protein